MTRLRNTIVIDASPEEVWTILGDLAATPEWLPGTVAARMEGPVRVCTTADGGEIREEIGGYSPERRTYRYRHLAVPLPVKGSSGRFLVEAGRDGGSVVVLESEFEPLDLAMEGQIEQMLDGALKQALESLRRRMEQGLRWDAT